MNELKRKTYKILTLCKGTLCPVRTIIELDDMLIKTLLHQGNIITNEKTCTHCRKMSRKINITTNSLFDVKNLHGNMEQIKARFLY